MSTDHAKGPDTSQKTMTATGATFLGIGAMIGAGIFALLGEAGAVAGSAVWLSFLLGACVTSLLAYVCVKMGIKYPSKGGLITFVVNAFGNGRVAGITAWLGYIAASIITCSLVAVSFGSYATSVFIGDDAGPAWDNIFTTLLILGVIAINFTGGTALVAKAQVLIVAAVLSSFAFFIVITLPNIDLDLLRPADYPSFSKIIASIALTFFAYMGFNVITFASGDMRNPSSDVPRAMTQAIGVTAITYILIAVAVFGTLTVAEVSTYGETAIAEAARPELGDFGFTLMAATAMLSTAGATNATLYAAGNLTGKLAEDRMFPPFFGSIGTGLRSKSGLLVTSGIVLVIANLVDLTSIASVGSAVALMLFLLVVLSGYRLRAETGSNVVIIILALLVTAVVLGFFAVNTLRDSPETFTAIAVCAVAAVAIDYGWAWYRDNNSEPAASTPAS